LLPSPPVFSKASASCIVEMLLSKDRLLIELAE
jgi:hypothetical protein